MFKSLIIAAALATTFATSSFAMDCTQAELDKLDVQVKAMTDKTAQTTAMADLQTARDAMTKKDAAACATLMDSISKAAPAK
jgi:hypothetical protein